MDAKQLHPNNEDIVVAEKPIREIRILKIQIFY